jgi:hypothetical protein
MCNIYTQQEAVVELHRTQIILGKKQHEALSQIAEEEQRSLSEIVREMIDRELLYRQRRQMMQAARELQSDYRMDPDLKDFSDLDSEDFLFEDEENA